MFAWGKSEKSTDLRINSGPRVPNEGAAFQETGFNRGLTPLANFHPIHRAMIYGIVGVSLLFIAGCDSDPQPLPHSPASQPATGSPTTPSPPPASPNQTIPTDSENTDPGDAAAKNAAPKPTYTASDFGDVSKEPKPKPVETKPAKTALPSDPNEAMVSLLQGGKTFEEVEKTLKSKLRPRPEDVTEWKLMDVFTAICENDPKFKLAIVSLSQKHMGNPAIAVILSKLLKPQTPSKTSVPTSPSPGHMGGMPNQYGMGMGMPGNPGYMGGHRAGQVSQIDRQTAENIVYALAINNTPQAAKTLREVIKNKKFEIVHPQVVTKAALQGLAVMDVDRDKNDEVLFTVLTSPEQYRDSSSQTPRGGGYPDDPMMMEGYYGGPGRRNGEQRMSAEQLCQEAEKTLKPIASEGLRQLLAEYLIKSTTPLEETDRFCPWLSEPLPMNVPGQLIIYKKKSHEDSTASLDAFLAQLEESFTLYSGTAMARLLGILQTTPDLSSLGQAGMMGMTNRTPAGWGAGRNYGGFGMEMPGGYSGGYRNNTALVTQILSNRAQKTSPEKELIRLTKQIWNNQTAAAVATRLDKQIGMYDTSSAFVDPMMPGMGAGNADQDIILACTMPVDTIRRAIFKRCKSQYQHGPDSALGNVFGPSNSQNTGMDPAITLAAEIASHANNTKLPAVDPGLLVVLKMFPREDPNIPTAGNHGRSGGIPYGPGGGNIQHQWFNTSQQLVTKVLSQCLIAAINNNQEILPTTGDGESAEDPCPLALHRDAEIVKRLDFKLPGPASKSLGNLPVGPLEIHYVRIEETSNLQKVLNHYKRTVKGQNHLLANNMGYWFDAITEGTTPDKKRSVDVVVSPGIPKPVDPFSNNRNARRKNEVPIIVQILTVETTDPSK